MNLIGRNLDNAVKSLNLPDTVISLLRLTRGKATQEVQHKEKYFFLVRRIKNTRPLSYFGTEKLVWTFDDRSSRRLILASSQNLTPRFE